MSATLSAVVLCAAAGAVILIYVRAVSSYRGRFPGHIFSGWRITAFVCGVVLIAGALWPAADALADRSFAWHMAQHVALMMVAPPLVWLGAPLLLAVAVPSRSKARVVAAIAKHPVAHAIFEPIAGWLVFVAVLWGAHFSPLYEAALEFSPLHVLEHVLFLVAAFLFWMPVVQVGFAPRPVAFPARILYLVLMFPQGAFLGLAIYSAGHVMYPHYALVEGARALADQQNGGAVMWIAGGFIMFVAFMLTMAVWAASERSAPRMTIHA